MSSSKRFRRFQRAIARYGLYTSAWLFERLPYGFVRFITGILITIGFRCTIRQRRFARESLDIAFGDEKSVEEKKKIIKKCFESFGRGMIELLYHMSHPEESHGTVSFEGKEHLDKAMAQGKGVIAVTAHFGNFPLMMMACARQGYKTSSIIRQTRDEELTEFLHKKRAKAGLGTIYAIPRRKCVIDSLKELRDGNLLFIPIDQNFGGNGGIFVDFFGQKAATATGPAVFALRTGAPILPMFSLRQADNTQKIVIEPPIEIEDCGSEKETILAVMTKVTNLVERYIRQYPYEWAWMHRRWKSRPPGSS